MTDTKDNKLEPRKDEKGNPICDVCEESVKEVTLTDHEIFMCACCVGRRGIK